MTASSEESKAYCTLKVSGPSLTVQAAEELLNQFKPCTESLAVFDFSTVKTFDPVAVRMVTRAIEAAVGSKVAILGASGLNDQFPHVNAGVIFINYELSQIDEKLKGFANFEMIVVQVLKDIFSKRFNKELKENTTQNSQGETDSYTALAYLISKPFIGGMKIEFSGKILNFIVKQLVGEEMADQEILKDSACEIVNWTISGTRALLTDQGFSFRPPTPPMLIEPTKGYPELEPFRGVYYTRFFNSDAGSMRLHVFGKKLTP